MLRFLLFLLLLFPAMVPAQQIIYDNGQFFLDKEPPIVQAPGAAKKPFWRYFWDFGDGTYCMGDKDERMNKTNHTFMGNGPYTVRVFLTPYYATVTQKVVIPAKTISVRGNGKAPSICNSDQAGGCSGKEYVDIASNADGELVPGSEVQLIIHYKAPVDQTGGKLVLAFNSKAGEEKMSAPALVAPQAAEITARNPEIKVVPADNAVNSLLGKEMTGLQTLTLLTGKMKAGEERCIFLTFKTRGGKPFKLANLGKRTSVRAHWIPNEKKDGKAYYSTKYWLKISDYHDPNKMTVTPHRSFYKKGTPSRIKYTVHYQNDGPGEVRDIQIMIPWSNTLDAASIVVQEVHPACPVCPPGFNPAIDTTLGCYTKDLSKIATDGKLYFHFYNIIRYGKKQEGIANKHSKGHITYTVMSNDERADKTRSRALITFLGKTPIPTQPAKTHWRYRTIGLKAGFLPTSNLENYNRTPDGLGDRTSFGLWMQQSPLKTGIGYGVEVNYSGFRFTGYTTQEIGQSALLPGSGGMITKDAVRIRSIEAGANFRAQWNGLISGFIGGGISAPIGAVAQTEARIFSNSQLFSLVDSTVNPVFGEIINQYTVDELFDRTQDIESTARTNSTARFGLFQKQQDTKLFNQEISSRRTLGYYGSIGLEVGLLGDASLGFRQDIRYYPNFYQGRCMTIFNTELSLKVRLVVLK